MNRPADQIWAEANQRDLAGALHRVRSYVERGSRVADRGAGIRDRTAAVVDHDDSAQPRRGPAALESLRQAFGLSGFECDLLLLCAGVELDASFAELVAAAQAPASAPTFGLGLAVLPNPHWSAITPGGALRRWRMVEVGTGEQLVRSALRIDERVLHYLTGLRCPDERLAGYVEAVDVETPRLAPSQAAVADEAAGVWREAVGAPPVLQILGAPSAEKGLVASALADRLGVALHRMPAQAIPAAARDRAALMRLWEREAVLSQSALLVEGDDLPGGDAERTGALREFLEGTRSAIILCVRERMTLPRRATISYPLRRPTRSEQRQLWMETLGSETVELNGQVDRIAAQFDLSAPAMESAYQQAVAGREEDGQDFGHRLWAACRAQARPQLADLAEAIVPAATWDDLVLPHLQMQTLREAALHVRERLTVHERWGFSARSSRGLGITALFAGPSGTGKTMAAEVLAGELDLDLYRVDLSRVVSKYIGETEKNLGRVFDAAEEGGAILLFDEADALFGKRSEVKDSHDRYANIEVGYLLQRMEAYGGMAILTTNQKSALDDAFLRRLRFVVSFPFPSAEQRSRIWSRIFPQETPTEALDVEKLGRLNVAGGNIRNIALGAAFLAAGDGSAVGMEHLLRAARTEYAKLERPLTDSEIRGWT